MFSPTLSTQFDNHSSRPNITEGLKRSYPESSLEQSLFSVWNPKTPPRTTIASGIPYLILLRARVWLFSLRRLPRFLPFPKSGSMPRTFSLFHCSSPYDGGALPQALLCEARTFLVQPKLHAIICKTLLRFVALSTAKIQAKCVKLLPL